MFQLHRTPVAYESRLDSRPLEQIDLLVVHCTELPGLELAREYAERVVYAGSQTGACGHFYVGKGGELFEYVDMRRIANHCVAFNPRSIGIELDNLGRYPDWLHARHQQFDDPYPDSQIEALLQLIESLRPQLPRLRWIAGHQELDTREVEASDDPDLRVCRKLDPGRLFPWDTVLRRLDWLQHAVPPTGQAVSLAQEAGAPPQS